MCGRGLRSVWAFVRWGAVGGAVRAVGGVLHKKNTTDLFNR